ncbi:MAG TPA: MarR family winged helix-turn-helix transcriptional regulator [Roseiflexaceae bacterium]|nr:MarR family winged helix-turn-helix transcriptional regulator [Roseiflexaceae bacterium]
MKANAPARARKNAPSVDDAPSASAAALMEKIGQLERAGWPFRDKAERYTGEWNVGFLVRDMHRSFRLDLRDRIAKYGVLISMWSYLWALYHEDGLSQGELARRVKLMGPSVVAAINVMERHKLVKRVRSKQDRRVVHIFLTPKARALRGAMMREVTNTMDRALAYMSNADIEQLCKLLDRVRLGLNSN